MFKAGALTVTETGHNNFHQTIQLCIVLAFLLFSKIVLLHFLHIKDAH